MKKKNRTSRKGKKAWRKNAEVDEIEDDYRQSKIASESNEKFGSLSDDALFSVDKGTESSKSSLLVTKEQKKDKGKLSRTQLAAINKLASGIASNKVKLVNKAKERAKEKAKAKSRTQVAKYDIWDEANAPVPTFEQQYQLVDPVNPRVYETVSKRPAIEVTDISHLSYNPTYEAHQDSLGIALARKLKSMENKKRLEKDIHMVKEFRVGKGIGLIIDTEEQNPQEDAANQTPETAAAVSEDAQPKPKGRKVQKTKKIDPMKEKRRERHKMQKKFDHDLVRVKSLSKAVQLEIESKEEAHKIKAEIAKDADLKTKRLGPYWFQEPKADYLLSNEIPENLKDLKLQGNLIEERFKSLQKRNMIEPRRRVSKRMVKRKSYIEGASAQKARQMQDQINAMRKSQKHRSSSVNDI